MSNSEMKERCCSCGTLRTGGWETVTVQGEALCRPQADPRDNLLRAFMEPRVAAGRAGSQARRHQKDQVPLLPPPFLPFLQTPGPPTFLQVLGSGSWVSAAPLAHGVSRTRLPAHWDWQHQPGHRDLGEEERGVMYRRVCVEGDEILSPGHPEVLKSVVTSLPTPRISCTASVLTLDSYQSMKEKSPSAPAEWSLDTTSRPPNPQFPALSNGSPSIRANSAPQSDTCTHRRWTLATSGSPCLLRQLTAARSAWGVWPRAAKCRLSWA